MGRTSAAMSFLARARAPRMCPSSGSRVAVAAGADGGGVGGSHGSSRGIRSSGRSSSSSSNSGGVNPGRQGLEQCRRGRDGGDRSQWARESSSMATAPAAPFPSLIISKRGIEAQGPFAETQATFLSPDAEDVSKLDKMLEERAMGVVAHFYMDAELQGTLAALKWPHVCVADSLAMGDAAVKMAQGGAKSIACLGVDFMSESVKATLDASGYGHVPVYRLSEREIGCSLATAAEKTEYAAFLHKAAKTPNSLHVVYINTSLITKAQSQTIIPTITCTSSNVLHTVLQAFHQIPDLTLWYGPDTYMGENLFTMLKAFADLSDSEIQKIHPDHSQASIRALLPRFHYFKQGNCVVHHMFGDSVVKRVRANYKDAFHTAHLEVPGEMFDLAMTAQRKDKGVVGSTSNILNFIKAKTADAVAKGDDSRLQFVLGTEAGMVTSIVRGVESQLSASKQGAAVPEVEIVFPVASEAFAQTTEEGAGGGGGAMAVVPGVSGGEGCSSAGGCATCPFMKMNDLDALMDVVRKADASGTVPTALDGFLPRKRTFMWEGSDQTGLGVVPILHMRDLMRLNKLSDELVKDITSR